MGAKKYTRVSDTGLVMNVTRSIRHAPLGHISGSPDSSNSNSIDYSFERRYEDANFTLPSSIFSLLNAGVRNHAGYYYQNESTKAISSFYTIFGNNPAVDVPLANADGNYQDGLGAANLLKSRLSKGVFGDPMFYKSNPQLVGTVPAGGTSGSSGYIQTDPRFVVSSAGTNREFVLSSSIEVAATDCVTEFATSDVQFFTMSATASFSYPSDGLAYPDGGHPYRSFMADSRAIGRQSGDSGVAFSPQGNDLYCRGFSALGLLPKTEVYPISASTADFVQYPGGNALSRSYSPRMDYYEEKFLPATGDADLRGFHGQYWVLIILHTKLQNGYSQHGDYKPG